MTGTDDEEVPAEEALATKESPESIRHQESNDDILSDDEKNKENKDEEENEEEEDVTVPIEAQDPEIIAQNKFIAEEEATTDLEKAMKAQLARKDAHIERLTNEIHKLKAFISKRKQTYKRKRKDEGAPTRALSAYNIFIKERFAQLAKQNEDALKSADSDAVMKRVPPSNLVSATGNEWKELSAEEKAKYEERAKEDRKRYEEQMAQYQPPDKHSNRKRNKTGYNMFFSAHVLRLKQTESGVPSERGSVARLVGTAWKQLSADEKQYYEREADKHNGMHPLKEGEEEDEEEEVKRHHMEHYHVHPAHEMHIHGAVPPPPMHSAIHQQYDPRHHAAYYPPHLYGQQVYAHYDYSQHHQRHPQTRSQGYAQGYPSQRHPYEGGM